MKSYFKILLFLILFSLTINFASCNNSKNLAISDEQVKDAITEATDNTDVSQPDAPFNGEIVTNGISDYIIVRPDKGGAESAAQWLLAEIESKTGAEIQVKTDFEKQSAGIVRQKKELCIGMTNRDENGRLASTLGINDYIITSDPDTPERIHIIGGSDEASLSACKAFIEKYTTDNSIVYTEPLSFADEYAIKSFTIAGRDIKDFRIAYTSSLTESTLSETLATELRDLVANLTGKKLELVSSAKCKQDENLILVGATLYSGEIKDATDALRQNDYCVKPVGESLLIYGATDKALSSAVEYFKSTYLSDSSQGDVKIAQNDIYEVSGTYDYNDFSLAGKPIHDYVIVAQDGINNTSAINLRNSIASVSGYHLNIVAPAYTGDKNGIIYATSGYKASDKAVSAISPNCHGTVVIDGDIYLGFNGKLLTDASLTEYFLKVLSISSDGNPLTNTESIDISEAALCVEKVAEFDFEIATDEIMAEIDQKTDALKQSILESKTEIFPKDGADVYYVSNSGSNLNDGKTPESAWLTLDKVSSARIAEGSYVFFERGCTFRGNLTTQPGVTYSAYGEGPKPIIMASPYNAAEAGKWEETDTPNVYRYNRRIAGDVGLVVFDGGESYAVKITAKFTDGKPVSDYATGLPFTSYKDLPGDMFFYHDLGHANVSAIDDNHGFIYLRSDHGNPAERFDSIEFNPKNNVIQIKGDGITIDNLHVAHGGSHGVGSGTANKLTVQNCEFSWIGGSIQYYKEDGTPVRFGNAVEIYGSCNTYTVKNCYIHDVYDAGVTHQRSGTDDAPYIMENVTYENNLFINCIYSIEYFNQQDNLDTNIMRNILFKNNICRNAGGFGWQRPNKVARHIQGGWKGGTREYPAENYVVEGNIFDRSCDVLLSVSSDDASDMPVMNGNTYIQYFDRNYGMVGVPYDKYYPYDANIKKVINEFTGDKNARVIMILDEVRTSYPEDFHVNHVVGNTVKQ